MNRPRLAAAVISIVLFGAALTWFDRHAAESERTQIHALAPLVFDQKNQGAALQREAFRQADLLPLYGSSELVLKSPYQPSTLFRDRPTGFTVFPVAKPGNTCLVILQKIAAAGADIRGRKIAVSLSPLWFFREAVHPDAYAGNFSDLHAGELAFSSSLSYEFKHQAARRMLDYPKTVAGNPVLRFALERLARDSVTDRLLYYAACPVGTLQNVALRLQDHWTTSTFLQEERIPKSYAEDVKAHIDWPALMARSTDEAVNLANNNPFGIDNEIWELQKDEVARRKGSLSDQKFLSEMNACKEWVDYDLLLRALEELGAKPLMLSMPMNGPLSDYQGVSERARQAYYQKVSDLAQSHGADIVNFAEHDDDKYFLFELGYHLSRKGWVYYDHAMDVFFHDDRP
jgi:D-alanine transfer protein